MIKASFHDRVTGEVTLFFGFTDLNLEKLKAGEAISINLSDLGMRLVDEGESVPLKDTGRLLISYGKNNRTIGLQLGLDVDSPGPGDETRIRFDHKDITGHGHGPRRGEA